MDNNNSSGKENETGPGSTTNGDAGGSDTTQTQKNTKTPARYKLYDGIKEKVSLRMMDNIIIAIIALVLILLLIGIFGD